ncbi:MAG: nucleotide-binding protein [Planctomycetes bacterium]|nr:nucleotide-binding protein [Planctomycetota bacterium]
MITNKQRTTLIERLESQATVARAILSRAPEMGLREHDRDLFERWIAATMCIVRDNLGIHEATKFDGKVGIGGPDRLRCKVGLQYVEALIRVCREFPEQLTFTEPAISRHSSSTSNSKANQSRATGKDVFLVHGHDELNTLRLQKHLREKHALNAVILAEAPGKGRTLIEKFEEEALKASVAFALLTPDDVIQASDGTYAQARPNVTFEIGWFYGRLGRNRVCLLLKKGSKIHSDLDGINRIEFQDSVLEVAVEIEKELRASGLIK